MDWIKRWQEGKTGWHRTQVNTRLMRHLPQMGISAGTVFVPLCGKSVDMLYLAQQGYRVIGVELSEIAIRAFFTENNLTFRQENNAFISEHIVIYHKSFFDLTASELGEISWIYDRASLVALDNPTRTKYAQHLRTISNNAPLLLLTLNYADKKAGPPFAVDEAEVRKLFTGRDVNLLERVDDIANEPKFQEAGATWIHKESYRIS